MPAHRRELIFVVYRTQFRQQLITVSDHARRRRFQKRKILHVANLQRFHAQNYRRQRRSQNFGISKFVTRGEIFLVIETYAHARRHAPATARTLIGGGARDFFDLQQLNLVAIAVAVDARKPGVDHIPYTGHRQRCFRYVGRQHNTPVTVRFEHTVLFFKRQPREQRQNLRAAGVVLAQRFGGFAYLAFAGQKHQNIAA